MARQEIRSMNCSFLGVKIPFELEESEELLNDDLELDLSKVKLVAKESKAYC